ncbi:MAG TPA: hypothetical protein PKO06_00615 [Candidatus Ozemobacteraceae bacterium]|nr:hypothetical protein [Candidatus Ozemobacteraceae bacterium]
MMTLTMRRRQPISLLLVLTMFLSTFLVAPATSEAGLMDSVKSVSKWLFVKAGSLGAAYGGAVLGMAIGGGPIGMVLGGVGGYIVGKKVMEWGTSNSKNFWTLAGGLAGAALTVGMGWPVMLAGVAVGALGSRALASVIGKIFNKAKAVAAPVTAQAAAKMADQDAKAQAFIDQMMGKANGSSGTTAAQAAVAPMTAGTGSQGAYDRYLSAYKTYMDATQKGDAQAAQQAYTEYQSALKEYRGGK